MSQDNQPKVASTSQMRIGAPVSPLDETTIDLIATLVEGLEAIAEAHLPMVYIPDVIDPPSVTLAIVPYAEVQDVAKLADVLTTGLKLILDGASMQIMPVPPDGGLAKAVRASGTQIFPRSTEA